MDIKNLLNRPIAFHRVFVTLTGSVNAAVMLSQAFYWSNKCDESGWFYKTQAEWEEETGLTRYEQEGARKLLLQTGFWFEEKKGLPAKLYFRINEAILMQKLQVGENQHASLHTQASMGKTSIPAVENTASILFNKTTTETTDDEHSENTKDKNKYLAEQVIGRLNILRKEHGLRGSVQYTESRAKLIKARMKESKADLKEVSKMLEYKIRKWKGTEWEKYLRPETLFSPSKFQKYMEEVESEPVKTDWTQNGSTFEKEDSDNALKGFMF